MTTADWALLISLGSLFIAMLSFIWNVWSKFIYPKPKIKSHISVMSMIPNPDNDPDFVTLNATNYGPTEVILYAAVARPARVWSRLWKKPKLGLLNPMDGFPAYRDRSNGPFSGGLPKKVAVGEQFSVYFPISKKWAEDKLVRYGFTDTFGRFHWCSRKNGKEFLDRLNKEK